MITQIPINIITIQDDGCHLMIEILVNNKKASMLIDTGASKTAFDIKKIKKFIPDIKKNDFELIDKTSTGIGTNSLESYMIVLKKIKIANFILKNYKAVVIDMQHINESYSKLKLPLIDGILGGDLLIQQNAVIDYKNKILKIKY